MSFRIGWRLLFQNFDYISDFPNFLPLYVVMLGLLYLKPHITVDMQAKEMEKILWNETFLESCNVYYASKNGFS